MKTNIEWATHSLNFYTWDCTKVSEGCKHCYMMVQAEKYGKPLVGRPQWRGKNAMKELRKLPTGAVVFVNSMSDTYHESVPAAWIHSIHNMAAYERPDVTFLLLTKRPERALAMSPHLIWPPNLWIGTSVESERYLYRLQSLLQIPATGHFLSAEPLLGPLTGLDDYLLPRFKHRPGYDSLGFPYPLTVERYALKWVIVGGESGAERRPLDKAWAREIREMCYWRSVPFMFKQGSAYAPGRDRLLDGRTWDESPFVSQETSPPTPLQTGEGRETAVIDAPMQLRMF